MCPASPGAPASRRSGTLAGDSPRVQLAWGDGTLRADPSPVRLRTPAVSATRGAAQVAPGGPPPPLRTGHRHRLATRPQDHERGGAPVSVEVDDRSQCI